MVQYERIPISWNIILQDKMLSKRICVLVPNLPAFTKQVKVLTTPSRPFNKLAICKNVQQLNFEGRIERR